MATGALDTNGVWLYGEDDSETTFSELLNLLGTSIGSDMKGRILQVVSSTYSVEAINSTTTYAAAGLSATITPKKASSKIIVIANVAGTGKDGTGNSQNAQDLQLRRGATTLATIGGMGYTSTVVYALGYSAKFALVDSPASTSAQTYAVYQRCSQTGQVRSQFSSSPSTCILIEVSQ